MNSPPAPSTLDYRSPSAPDDSQSVRLPRLYRWIGASMLVFGLQVWLVFGRGYWGRTIELKLLLVVVALCLIPHVRFGALRAFDALANPSPRARRSIMAGVFLVSTIYLYATARYQKRHFIPVANDEFSYMLQARILAQGRLWMPPHPLADFFDTTFVITSDRAYASAYFPGTAMLLVPGVWLGMPYWFMPLLVAAAAVAMLYRISCELFDGFYALLAALMLLALEHFRLLSIQAFSQVPAMTLGLAMVLAYLKWRSNRRILWAIALGVASGWAAITRPTDALCYAIPIGIAIVLDVRATSRGAAAALRPLVAVVAAALPFLMIQLIFNVGVTGRWTQFPYDSYAERYMPNTSLGFHSDGTGGGVATTIPSLSPLKQHQYVWARAEVVAHRPSNILTHLQNLRLPILFRVTLPNRLLTILTPLGIVAMFARRLRTHERLWMIAIVPFAFMGIYVFFTFFLLHYAVVPAPAMITIVLASAIALTRIFPVANYLSVLVPLVIVMLSIAALPEFDRNVRDQFPGGGELKYADAAIAKLPHRPAVVLFPFDPARLYLMRIYNTDAAWPDDAPVIRANDLGPQRNGELFAYYAQHQPDRAVYRYDYRKRKMTYLGTARELHQQR